MLLVALSTIGALVGALFLSIALIGYGPGWWVATVVVYAASLLTIRGAHRFVKRSLLTMCGVIALIAAAGAVVGGVTTELINGVPVANGSKTGQIQQDINTIDSYLRVLQRADALLVLDETVARARVDELSGARSQMRDMAATANSAQAANDILADAYASVARAADAAFVALDGKVQLVAQYDSRVEAEVELARSTLVAEALRAGQLTRQAASLAGIPIGVRE